MYCEGGQRRGYSLNYVSHVTMPGVCPLLWWGCMLELMVDRRRGSTVNGQWTQDPRTVCILGAYIHVFHLREAMMPEHRGKYMVCPRRFEQLYQFEG